ncbi:MAG: CRISPR-associated endonuclease Cas1 [Pseudomonadota bacterium]
MKTRGKRETLISATFVARRAFCAAGLEAGWQRVYRNGGAAGGDGISVEAFRAGVVQRLADLRHDLDRGHYQPGAIRRVMIPKKSGGQRPLDIPSVRDRIVHTALSQVLMPLLDEEFETGSFGYRPGRSVRQAVDRVSALRRSGFTHVVDADIERFFERVDHDRLLARLADSLEDGPVTHLLAHWLEHSAPGGRGLAQGSPISPLLANLYLDRLDEALSGHGLAIVRFADDFVVLARSPKGADAALEKTERLLAREGLVLNRAKTRVTDFDAGFRFLGRAFVRAFALPLSADEDMTPDEGAAPSGVEALLSKIAKEDADAAARQQVVEDMDARRARARLDPGQRVLYLTTPGRRLSLRNFGFVVQEAEADGPRDPITGERSEVWHDLITIHPDDVDRIDVGQDCDFDRGALDLALATDTNLAFVNGHGQTLGHVTQGLDGRAARHLAQARCCLDADLTLAFAKRFVDGRVRNQRALLRRLNRDQALEPVIKSIAGINHLISRLSACPDLETLRGLEGRAAALYWPAYGRLLRDPALRFRKRNRKNTNAPNTALNITANLLARDCGAALQRVGLHPGFGMLHVTRNHGEAAVYDFMELFRGPLAEAVVSSAINQRVIDKASFERGDTPKSRMRLRASGMRGLIRAYERACQRAVQDPVSNKRRTWRAQMTDQAIRLARAMEQEAPEQFEPIIMDY